MFRRYEELISANINCESCPRASGTRPNQKKVLLNEFAVSSCKDKVGASDMTRQTVLRVAQAFLLADHCEG